MPNRYSGHDTFRFALPGRYEQVNGSFSNSTNKTSTNSQDIVAPNNICSSAVRQPQNNTCSGSSAANSGTTPSTSIAFLTPARQRLASPRSATWNNQLARNSAGTAKTC